MGKTRRGAKEYSREQRLINENNKLKRDNARMRKQLARLDLDRFQNAKDLIEQHYQEDSAQEGKNIVERLKKEWACHEPNCDGYLEIFLYNKIDATWYFRQCSNPGCRHRTASKPYTPGIKGIRKETSKLED